jgi:hypothetical protein
VVRTPGSCPIGKMDYARLSTSQLRRRVFERILTPCGSRCQRAEATNQTLSEYPAGTARARYLKPEELLGRPSTGGGEELFGGETV